MQCPKFLQHILTEPDNKTFCLVKFAGLLGVLTFLSLGIANYVQHAVFEPQNYAVGFGAMLGGVGAALKLKKDTPDVSSGPSPSSSGS